MAKQNTGIADRVIRREIEVKEKGASHVRNALCRGSDARSKRGARLLKRGTFAAVVKAGGLDGTPG